MFKYWISASFGMIFMAGVVFYNPVPSKDKDLSSVIQTSMARKHDLVSLETTHIFEATSAYTLWPMHGEVTTSAKVAYQWRTDLSGVVVAKVGDTYHIRVPAPLRSDPVMDYAGVKSYTDGSVVFWGSSIAADLAKENMAKIAELAKKDAGGDADLAKSNAKDDIRTLTASFGVPIVVE